MGGHGALIVGLKNPDKYRSISALAPMCDCSEGPLGSEGAAPSHSPHPRPSQPM